ncbi:MAG: NrfD/PsrC family molybdoenzyme membrane anchor subunit [SAR324 cluster bacterium]|nr:NrfD/PsrC family molybdoenzyme membrane anchor subunit [SAR324 cluster bacterium]
MESIVLMNSKWGNDLFVPMYLFFGGLTGGLFIVAVLADLIGIKHKPFENLSKVTAYITIPALALAGLFITFHLGKPERGILFPFFFTNYKSWLVIGGWSVGLAVPIVAGYAALWFFRANQVLRRLLGIVGVPLLGFVSFYTGLLLSGAKFVPLWSQQYLPYLFLSSGILTGMAGAGLMFVFYRVFLSTGPRETTGVLEVLRYGVLLAILVELLELDLFMRHLASNPEKLDASGQFVVPNGSAMAYEYVTQGPLADWFWWGIIGVGMTLPLILTFVEMFFRSIIRPFENLLTTAKFACVLTGGVILRFVIVWGGDFKAPLNFPPALFQIPISG